MTRSGEIHFGRLLRTTALVVLLFFTWTMGGVAGLAHAAKLGATQGPAPTTAREKAPEERLEGVLAEVEAELDAPVADMKTLRQQLTTKRGEIASLDAEIRRQFVETEKQLRDASLPAEILQRHERFARHYSDNLQQFTDNLAAVENADTAAAAAPAIERARAHLTKTKTPSRHQPLDPNNLPHRQPKALKREPRLRQEEFQRDLKNGKSANLSEKRILVASAGFLAGLLSPDDLAETIEVQLTPAIRAKAQELGNDPVKIYNWVRNTIEFIPTWGSIQGAQLTLETRQGNAFDTASLLIALLRAAGIEARYVTGTVELPIDKVMNWLGGFTEPQAALEFMASGGVPVKAGMSGNTITKALFEHVWVEAWIDYLPSRGARHKPGKGDTWISLDPSFKQYSYTQGLDIKSAVPFDAQSFVDQIKATATINETAGYATGVNSLLVQQTMQDYQTRVQSYIEQNHPNATVGDVLGKKEIVKQEFPYLLGTLPYRTAVKGAIFATIPDSYRHKLAFNVKNETVTTNPYVDPDAPTPVEITLSLTRSLPELAGKKITLSYAPATPQDEAVIASYLPKPHADGSPIQPSELPSQLPAYLIKVKPELRIDGQVVATGATIGLGGTNIFTLTFSSPAHGSDQITNLIDAGVYQAIGLNLGRISENQLTNLKAKLETTKAKLEAQNFTNLTKDDLVGDLLYTTALAYHAEFDTTNAIAARTMGVNALTLPSETIFATKLKVMTLFGIPRYASPGGLAMDADRLASVVIARDGNDETEKQFMLSSGMTSSALEHSVPEQLFSTLENPVEGISAIKALQLANNQGIPIYTVNQQNINTVPPQLQVDSYVKADIQNAVNAGKVVTVSKTNINFKGWNGCGYIVADQSTGSGAYMISGNLSGGNVGGEEDALSKLDNLFLTLGIKNNIIEAITGSPIFKIIGVKIGLVGLLVSVLSDLQQIKDMQDPAKKYSATILIASLAIFAGLAVFLTVGAVSGPIFPIIATAVYTIAIVVVINFIKTLILDHIIRSDIRIQRNWC